MKVNLNHYFYLKASLIVGIYLIAANACSPSGPRSLAATHYWGDNRDISISWTWKRTDETRELKYKQLQTLCFAKGVLANHSANPLNVSSATLILQDSDGISLDDIYKSFGEEGITISPGNSYEFEMRGYVKSGLLSNVSSLSARLGYSF